MKKDVALFVLKYLTCQQVKVGYQKIVGLLQPLSVAEWKWERHDTVWVVVDRLTKSAHFLPILLSNSVEDLGVIYVREII